MKRFEEVMSDYNAISDVLKSCEKHSAACKKYELELAFTLNNARYVLAKDVLPVIAETISKYAGKRLGPKTKEKIVAEVKTLTNCSFWFDYDCHGNACSLHFYKLDSDGFRRGNTCDFIANFTDYSNRAFAVDNVIQAFDEKDLFVSGLNEYIEDVKARVCEIISTYNKIVVLNNELDEAIKIYNALSVDNISNLYNKNHFYSIY